MLAETLTMPQPLAHIAVIVRDYDEAIAWSTEKLGFTLVADEYQPDQDKRRVLIARVLRPLS